MKAQSKKTKQTVLAIEDQELLLTLLSDELTAAGYNVLTSKTGEDGLFQLKQSTKPVSMVLLDLILPKMDGFAVLQELKSDERFKNIPVIVLSNLGEEQNVKKAKDLGAIDYLIKADMTPDKIIDVVKKVEKRG